MTSIALPIQQDAINGCICRPENIKAVCNVAVSNMNHSSWLVVIGFAGLLICSILALFFLWKGNQIENPTMIIIGKQVRNAMIMFGILFMGGSLILAKYILM